METKEIDGNHVDLLVSQFEFGMMGNALNEVCKGFRVTDFRTKMGGDPAKVERVLDDMIPIYRKMERTGSPHASVSFSRFELRAIIGALKEVGKELEYWEMHARMRAYPYEVDEVLKTIVPIYRKMKQLQGRADRD